MSFVNSVRFMLVTFSAVCLIVVSCVGTGFGQTSTATLTGIIEDQNGAVLRNVVVTAIETNRNARHITRTNDTGSYTLPALDPGRYSIAASLPGFKKSVQDGIVLQVNQVVRIKMRLDIGSVEEAVYVTAPAPLLETDESSRGLVVDQRTMMELPLNGRDYNQLATLSPGVVPSTPRLAALNFKGAININGNRVFNNMFLLDGIDNVSYSSSYRGENVQVIQPSIEAVAEFKIQTNAYTAEFGRSSGGVINAAIRSGTNAIRGSIYEFLRNDAVDANNFFSNAFGTPKPVLQRNQFGAAVGGPIQKDKVFWFADYEGLRGREGVPQSRAVPSAQVKAGVFNTPMFDPFAPGKPPFGRNAFGQWVIPPDRWDPVAANIVALIPDPNVSGTNIYASTPVTRTRADQFDVRMDYQMSADTHLFGRYSFADSDVFRPGPLPGLADGSYSDAFGSNANRSQGIAVGMTHVFSPSIVGDFRLGWSRGNFVTSPPNTGVDGPAQVGLKNVPSDPGIVGGLPKIGLVGFDAVGRSLSTPQFQTPQSWNPRLTVSAQKGRHSLKFGFEFLTMGTKVNDLPATIGAMGFTGLFSGASLGDLLLGLPSGLDLTSFTVIHREQRLYSYFIQDDYKVSRNLTLNIGLRYEYGTPPEAKDNQFANFDPASGTMILAKDGSIYDRTLIHPDRNDWAPRIGFSYSPWSRWVLRGAYGVFYNHTVRQGREGMLGFNPPFLVDNIVATNAFGSTAVASAAPFRLVDGYPAGLLDPNTLSPTVYRRAQDPNQRSPYVQQFNFGIQRELTANLLLDVAYVGNKGTKLPALRNINAPDVIQNANGTESAGARPYPAFGDIQWAENRASSSYNSLQGGLEKRFSLGLSGRLSYTWSKTLTDAADHLSTSLIGPGIDTGIYSVPQNSTDLRAERGPAEFDIAHRVSGSYIFAMPWGRTRLWGRSWGRTKDLILGNWQMSGIYVFQTGLPLTATLGGPSVLNLGADRVARPNLIGNPELPASERTVERWFNTDAFTIPGPSPQAFGSEGVGVMRGPGYSNFDFSIAKNFVVGENRSFQFRTELFNAFNHANFGPPDIRREAVTFGRISTAASARVIQFGLKFYF
jgi:hypothetical protein